MYEYGWVEHYCEKSLPFTPTTCRHERLSSLRKWDWLIMGEGESEMDYSSIWVLWGSLVTAFLPVSLSTCEWGRERNWSRGRSSSLFFFTTFYVCVEWVFSRAGPGKGKLPFFFPSGSWGWKGKVSESWGKALEWDSVRIRDTFWSAAGSKEYQTCV